MGHIKFPSIEQFKNVIRGVSIRTSFVGKDDVGEPIYDGSRPKPVLKFTGTVKLHGSNAALVLLPDGSFQYQSRERILSIDHDNHGFAMLMERTPKEVRQHLFAHLLDKAEGRPILLYGEIAGGNVQGGVALAKLEKFFCIFAACYKGEGEGDPRVWIDMRTLPQLPASPEHRIFNIFQFPTYELEIDFNRPELVQNKLVEITEAVEKECPVGKAMGVSGIGEGVVWSCWEPNWTDAGWWFKVKGKEHSVSKVKSLAPVDVEKVANYYEFADKVITRPRCEQGLAWLKDGGHPITEKSTGLFLNWIRGDVLKEETDTIIASGLDMKDVGKAIGTHARVWYFNHLNKGDASLSGENNSAETQAPA